MFTALFVIFAICVFGDLLWLCIKLAWSAWKVVLTLVCLPLLIVFMVLGGMMALALPLLVVVGIVAIITMVRKTAANINMYCLNLHI